jgi:hypothetical protein
MATAARGQRPFYTREETSKCSDLITKTGKARIFTFTMEAGNSEQTVIDYAARARGAARNLYAGPYVDYQAGQEVLPCSTSVLREF